jgi:dimethylargininase
MFLALTRGVSPSIADCALTFRRRQPIDVERAMRQHADYETALSRLGAQVISLAAEPHLPDSVFVEDTAVVVNEIAVMTAPLLPSRRAEIPSVAAALAPYRSLQFVKGDAALEGGDVLRVGRILYVGLSRRTNREGATQLASLLEPHGYEVRTVYVEGCLHLKTACTRVGENTLLVNPDWVDMAAFEGTALVEVPSTELGAANALLIGETVLLPTSFPETRFVLEELGIHVETVDVSELEKAEAGVTCCSILFEIDG